MRFKLYGVFFFLIVYFLIVFFPLPLIPSSNSKPTFTPPSAAIITLPSTYMSLFLFFAQSLHLQLPPPELSAHPLFMSLSLCCLLLHFVQKLFSSENSCISCSLGTSILQPNVTKKKKVVKGHQYHQEFSLGCLNVQPMGFQCQTTTDS